MIRVIGDNFIQNKQKCDNNNRWDREKRLKTAAQRLNYDGLNVETAIYQSMEYCEELLCLLPDLAHTSECLSDGGLTDFEFSLTNSDMPLRLLNDVP